MSSSTSLPLDFNTLKSAVSGTATAFRALVEYQPAGGEGDKVFPPTYEGGKYAEEQRCLPGYAARVPCVLLDSVQSQANRMEQALLEAWEDKRISLPVLTVDFSDANLPKPLRITSLEAPHRIADALLRDSLWKGKPFRKSELGQKLDLVANRQATALFELCPTALVFGMWDSTGPRGGLGAKLARALVSEIVGIDFQIGQKTSSRRDPAEIIVAAGPLYQAKNEEGLTWTLDEKEAVYDSKKKAAVKYSKDNKEGEPGNPSKANHGNVTPSIKVGSVTMRKALQTTVLSLPALRRLRFPLKDEARSRPEVDDAARVVLAALSLCAAALNYEQGCDLRSRCLLHPVSPFEWELLDTPGDDPRRLTLNADQAVALFNQSLAAAKALGLPWMEEELVLKPAPALAELVRKSQELTAKQTGDAEKGSNS